MNRETEASKCNSPTIHSELKKLLKDYERLAARQSSKDWSTAELRTANLAQHRLLQRRDCDILLFHETGQFNDSFSQLRFVFGRLERLDEHERNKVDPATLPDFVECRRAFEDLLVAGCLQRKACLDTVGVAAQDGPTLDETIG